MAPQLYLITPPDADPATLPTQVMGMLGAAEFSALLVRRGPLDDAAYGKLVAQMINIGQGADCAVLVEDDVALARRVGADGVHVTTGLKSVREAVAALKPKMIVGAGPFTTRHDAMTVGELDVDYVLFGPLAGATDPAALELAQWWAETFEVPAVLSDPSADAASADSRGAEFVALSTSLWTHGKDHAAAVAARLAEET